MSGSHVTRPIGDSHRQRSRRGEQFALVTALAASVSPWGQLFGETPVTAPPLPPLPPAVEPTIDPAAQPIDWSAYSPGPTASSAPTCSPSATETVIVEPGRSRFRPLLRRTPASLPSPITPDPLTGVLQVELVSRLEPGCDPVLYGFWLSELRAAVNASPRFRVIDTPPGPGYPETARVGAAGSDAADAMRTAYGPGMPALTGDGTPADLRLCICARSITPFRPMRIDADVLLLDTLTGMPVARLDGVWQAPTEALPLRPTRKGWFRRDWHAPPAVTEAAALEANSPRMFLRTTAKRMAETLTCEVDSALPAALPAPPAGMNAAPEWGAPSGAGTPYDTGSRNDIGTPPGGGLPVGPGMLQGNARDAGPSLPPGSGFPVPPGLPPGIAPPGGTGAPAN